MPGVLVGHALTQDAGRRNLGNQDGAIRDEIETDIHGEAVFRDLPYDGSRSIVVRVLGATSGALVRLEPSPGRQPYLPIVAERLVYRTGAGHPLEVRVVDASRGKLVRGARVTIAGAPGLVPGTAGATLVCRPMLRVGRPTNLKLGVSAPEGWVAWELATWTVHISPYARRLSAHYPLRRELPVVVSILEPDGSAVRSPVLNWLAVAKRRIVEPVYTGDAYGRLRLRGIPWLPGEVVIASARRKDGFVAASAAAAIGDDPEREIYLEIVMPPENPNAIRMGGGAGGRFGRRGGSRNLLTGGGSVRRNRGSVTVTVLRSNGRPAAGAKVKLGHRTATANEYGRAHFRHVARGTHAVHAQHVGLLPMTGSVTVRGSEAARITVRERKGGRIQVLVVDDADRPLPYATLDVRLKSKRPWVDLDEHGTQRLDPFTDHQGQRQLRGLEPGRVTLEARWGGRSKQRTVEVEDRGSETIRIVLPAYK